MNNYILGPCDTDSISIAKPDMSSMTPEEQTSILQEINSLYPDKISWDNDGYFSCIICLKTKNYILWDGKKLKIKGSALQDQKKQKIIKEFHKEIIWCIINGGNNYTEIYNKYVLLAINIKDIMPWCSKRSLSEKVYSSDRTNETKVLDAISGTEYSEGDKVYLYFKEDKSLSLAENFNGEYSKDHMLLSLYKSTRIFDNVLSPGLFINYSLKRSKKLLETLC